MLEPVLRRVWATDRRARLRLVCHSLGMCAARRLAMFPLSTVLFPGGSLALHVFEPRYRALMTHCLAGDGEFGVVLIERGSEVGGGDHRVGVGTVARIESATPFPDGRWAVLVRGLERLRVVQWLPEDPYPLALVEDVSNPSEPRSGSEAITDRAHAAVRKARALLSELRDSPPLGDVPPEAHTPEAVAWWLCSEAPLNPLDRQRLLVADGTATRLELLAELAGELAADLSRLLADEPGG